MVNRSSHGILEIIVKLFLNYIFEAYMVSMSSGMCVEEYLQVPNISQEIFL